MDQNKDKEDQSGQRFVVPWLENHRNFSNWPKTFHQDIASSNYCNLANRDPVPVGCSMTQCPEH